MGISRALISQVENGRAKVPKGKRLKRFLDIYGIKDATFRDMAKNCQGEQTELDVVTELLLKQNNWY